MSLGATMVPDPALHKPAGGEGWWRGSASVGRTETRRSSPRHIPMPPTPAPTPARTCHGAHEAGLAHARGAHNQEALPRGQSQGQPPAHRLLAARRGQGEVVDRNAAIVAGLPACGRDAVGHGKEGRAVRQLARPFQQPSTRRPQSHSAPVHPAGQALGLLHQRRQERLQAVGLCRQLADVAQMRHNVAQRALNPEGERTSAAMMCERLVAMWELRPAQHPILPTACHPPPNLALLTCGTQTRLARCRRIGSRPQSSGGRAGARAAGWWRRHTCSATATGTPPSAPACGMGRQGGEVGGGTGHQIRALAMPTTWVAIRLCECTVLILPTPQRPLSHSPCQTWWQWRVPGGRPPAQPPAGHPSRRRWTRRSHAHAPAGWYDGGIRCNS